MMGGHLYKTVVSKVCFDVEIICRCQEFFVSFALSLKALYLKLSSIDLYRLLP